MQREPRQVIRVLQNISQVLPLLNSPLLYPCPSHCSFYLDPHNSFLSSFSWTSWSPVLFSTRRPTWSFKTVNQIMPLLSLTSSRGFSLHFEWNPNSLPRPMSCALARACLPLWPPLVLSFSDTLGFSFMDFLSVSWTQWVAVALGLFHELSLLSGMLFTQILCMADSLSFRSLCKCYFLREASGKPNLGFSPKCFLSIPYFNCHYCTYHQLSFHLFICFMSPLTRRQASWDSVCWVQLLRTISRTVS